MFAYVTRAAGYWRDHNELAWSVIVFGIIHIFLAFAGLVMFFIKRKSPVPEDNSVAGRVQGLYIPMMTFFWQFWLGFLLSCVPDTWLSGTPN